MLGTAQGVLGTAQGVFLMTIGGTHLTYDTSALSLFPNTGVVSARKVLHSPACRGDRRRRKAGCARARRRL
jgi:hypothetical protein